MARCECGRFELALWLGDSNWVALSFTGGKLFVFASGSVNF